MGVDTPNPRMLGGVVAYGGLNVANNVEVRFSWASKDCDTVYHLIPNPDGGSVDFKDGAMLLWEDAPDWKPSGHYFIPTEGLRAFAEMFSRAADIAGVK